MQQLADRTLKEDAAQTLSNLSQFANGGTDPGGFRVSDPGTSSHPHGPPSLAHLGAVPHQNVNMLGTGGMPNPPPQQQPAGGDGDEDGDDGEYVDKPEKTETSPRKAIGGGKGRGRGGAAMGSDEWSRQRKDNHVRLLSFFFLRKTKR
jgi:bHLH factor